MDRLAIMGGTFDPIHYGHLVTAEAARYQFALDKVIFVPSGRPPHKKEYPVTDAGHRYLMALLALASNPCFEVSRVEIDRLGYSYTVDTIAEFQEVHGAKARLFFITGADAILEILTWKDTARLMAMCDFIAVTRPGYHFELEMVTRALPEEARGHIHLMEVPALAISSTDIRRRVREGRPIKYLLPENVEQYIYKHELYVS